MFPEKTRFPSLKIKPYDTIEAKIQPALKFQTANLPGVKSLPQVQSR